MRPVIGLLMTITLVSGCYGGVGRKNTVIGGALVEKASGIEKAEVKAADFSRQTSVGGNQTNSSTNDSKMIESIFKGISAIFLAVIGFMKSRISHLAKQNDYLNESRHKYQDLWLMKLDPEFAKIKMEMEGKC